MPSLTSPALSLAAAATWGAADFSGGIAAKSDNPFRVVVVAHGTGLVLMVALALVFGEPLVPGRGLVFGAAAGAVGGIGLACFYKSLAVGTMGINAPLSAVITAMVPLLFGFATEGLPNALRAVGLLLALVSIWVIASPHGAAHKQHGVGLAVVAGFGFGGFLLLMKMAGPSGVYWPLAAARLASFLLMVAIVLSSGARKPATASPIGYMVVAGLLDSTANALYVLAAQSGRLDVAAVLSSLYPASTVVLARFILKERLSRIQAGGMFLALIAVALISI